MRKRVATIGRWTPALPAFVVLLSWAGTGFAYDVTDVTRGATITGRVTMTGHIPPPKRFAVKTGADVCGDERALTKVAVRNGRVKGVVITLEDVERGKPFPAHRDTAAAGHGHGAFHYAGGRALNLNVQLNTCSFGPFTGVIAADDDVQFVNHDAIKHVLHTYALRGRRSNMLKTIHAQRLAAGSRTHATFPAKRLHRAHAVVLTCDRHDFMENWLYVAENPYYALSDDTGAFTIDHIPPGDYTIVAWHPVLGTQEQHITVTPHDHRAADFTFTK